MVLYWQGCKVEQGGLASQPCGSCGNSEPLIFKYIFHLSCPIFTAYGLIPTLLVSSSLLFFYHLFYLTPIIFHFPVTSDPLLSPHSISYLQITVTSYFIFLSLFQLVGIFDNPIHIVDLHLEFDSELYIPSCPQAWGSGVESRRCYKKYLFKSRVGLVDYIYIHFSSNLIFYPAVKYFKYVLVGICALKLELD